LSGFCQEPVHIVVRYHREHSHGKTVKPK
jgi:hypothetical protein